MTRKLGMLFKKSREIKIKKCSFNFFKIIFTNFFLGFTIQLEEEKLRMQLEALQSQISAPTQFKGRLNELLSQVRLQNQVTGLSGGMLMVNINNFVKSKYKRNHFHEFFVCLLFFR